MLQTLMWSLALLISYWNGLKVNNLFYYGRQGEIFLDMNASIKLFPQTCFWQSASGLFLHFGLCLKVQLNCVSENFLMLFSLN